MILGCNKVTVYTDFGVCYENVEIEKSAGMPGFCCISFENGNYEIVNADHIIRICPLNVDPKEEEFVVQY